MVSRVCKWKRAKLTSIKKKIISGGYNFVALGAESFGRWGPQTQQFLTQLATHVAKACKSKKSASHLRNRWETLISVQLLRHNVQMISQRITRSCIKEFDQGQGQFAPSWLDLEKSNQR
eukprot:Platyproteum_vivax@DN7630_c3_g1_i7.p1